MNKQFNKREYAYSKGECEKCERYQGCFDGTNTKCRFMEMSHVDFTNYFGDRVSAYDAVIKSIEEELHSWKRDRQLKALLGEDDEGELIKV